MRPEQWPHLKLFNHLLTRPYDFRKTCSLSFLSDYGLMFLAVYICGMDITTAKLGVLGGGQLGKMLLQSALDFNVTLKILDPDPQAPCSKIAHEFVNGSLTDYDTVLAFGQDCDVITIEIENVNTDALQTLQKQGKKVFPEPAVIELIQDKRKQKTFYKSNRIPTAEFLLTESLAEVDGVLLEPQQPVQPDPEEIKVFRPF